MAKALELEFYDLTAGRDRFAGGATGQIKLISRDNVSPVPMVEPIPPITLPAARNPEQEGEWLKIALLNWLNQEYIPEQVNQTIATRAAQIFVRQRMEGENDLGSLVLAIVTEMSAFDFSQSFFGEFTVANAVSDLLLDSLGIDRCCGE